MKNYLWKYDFKNKGFSAIELITVIAVFSVLGLFTFSRFLKLRQEAQKNIATNSIIRIKIECESNNALGRDLEFTQINIIGYKFNTEDSNKCIGTKNFSVISIMPEDINSNPSFFYDFKSGKISCNYEGTDSTRFPDCKKISIADREKQRCEDIGDWSKAQKLLQAGHSYLDRDDDGQACETLGRKSNKPQFGEIIIKDCYDGDTCTTNHGEKIRLACIDTPELRGERAKPNEAKAARDFLNGIIKGQKVSIRRVTEDKYGRTVGELMFNGQNLQQKLVNEGHAKIYKKYSKLCKWTS
tara:strand:- start:5902 stop:6795 length:894 start_codon:yes stop_codon:yes gene_type:complete